MNVQTWRCMCTCDSERVKIETKCREASIFQPSSCSSCKVNDLESLYKSVFLSVMFLVLSWVRQEGNSSRTSARVAFFLPTLSCLRQLCVSLNGSCTLETSRREVSLIQRKRCNSSAEVTARAAQLFSNHSSYLTRPDKTFTHNVCSVWDSCMKL